MKMHPSIRKDSVAVITGAAMGIGFAIATRLAKEQMKIVLFDANGPALESATHKLQSAFPGQVVIPVQGDVTSDADLQRLSNAAFQQGTLGLLVNNAAVHAGAGPWQEPSQWRKLMEINFWSVLMLQHRFVDRMQTQAVPSAIVNVGSKEGITTPPGNAAYAVSKAAVRVITEQLAHELRNRSPHVSAHLLIPGYTFTPMNFPGIAADAPKPEAPWSAEQVADRMVEGMANDEFYLFCEDNESTRELDQRRLQWSADDLILGRPALSRWHPAYREEFEAFVAPARGDA